MSDPQRKAAYLKEELGVDAAVNYKTTNNLNADIAQACPNGIDVYFENVGGAHLEAVLDLMNDYGRIAVCGMIDQYNATAPVAGPANLSQLIIKKLKVQGFIVFDHWDGYPAFVQQMGQWLASGEVKARETVYDGVKNAPDAFIGLFTGKNTGKMLVKLSLSVSSQQTKKLLRLNIRNTRLQNFNYLNPTRILFGRGQIAGITKEIPAGARVLITYGGGSIKRNGTLDQVLSALEGFTVFQFGGIEPNPTYSTLMKAVELGRKENIDFLLAVGGGSVIDGTKFIAAAIPFEGDDPWTILSERAPITAAVPAGNVLTLPATGSESNSGAVITRPVFNDKLAFMHPLVFPQFAVLDPETTYSLPEGQTANGVVDAFVHTMEQYLTCRTGSEVQDRYAEGLLQTLIETGPKVLAAPKDYDARATVMWSANQALNGLIGQGVPQDWATHMIGHEITALHGVDHARTLAIVLPALMDVMRDQKGPKILQYGERVWGLQSGADAERIDQTIDKTRHFFEEMGIKTRLGDYGIKADGIPALVEQLKRHGMAKLGEQGNITPEVSEEILTRAL